MARILLLVGAVAVALSACSGSSGNATAPQDSESCPVTLPNGATPPGEAPNPDYHGNGDLWTSFWPHGVVLASAADVREDGSIAMKWPWWRGVDGRLTIEGRRLDASAAPLEAVRTNDDGPSGFQATRIIFPSAGCWEVTGKVEEASLTFTAIVVAP